jgi:ATP-dependent DNA helicase DinG
MSDRAVVDALANLTALLPNGDERPGQQHMAEAVASAITQRRHLVVQAGTGTGKTLAYLVPIVISGARAVIVTATRTLQDQLATKDLPFLVEHLDSTLEIAVLKGRSNYLCLQRLDEIERSRGQTLEIDGTTSPDAVAPQPETIARLRAWARESPTGDRAELDWSNDDRLWRAVSVGSDECPGASRCARGSDCFAERARGRAAEARVVVVNTHLYGQHVRSDNAVLPEHEVVVFDETHVVEDIMSDTVGLELTGGRFTALLAAVNRILVDPQLTALLAEAPQMMIGALGDRLGERVGPPLDAPLSDLLADLRLRLDRIQTALSAIETTDEDARQRLLRARMLLGRLSDDIDAVLAAGEQAVIFVSGRQSAPRLEVAPLDVGPLLRSSVWDEHTAILTSATVPSGVVERLGLPDDRTDVIDVGSPFDYPEQALLYCAMDLVAPNDPQFRDACHEELEALINAAGGRTLALFTSWSALDAAVEALTPRLEFPILSQRDLPQSQLIKAFTDDERTCLFATATFFQGVDIPGPSLSLVVIDRLPFPRPDDPLLSARREAIGAAAFMAIDVPRAATMLAQAAGRLIRSRSDTGVVAVLDRRLGAARYRWDIIRSLPPMRRSRDRQEAIDFLRALDH